MGLSKKKVFLSLQLTLGLRFAESKAVTLTAVKAAKTHHQPTHVSAVESSRISVNP